jgi:hypothetical protein
MAVYFLPHGAPRRPFASLAHVPLAGGEVRPRGDLPARVGDLAPHDHLVAFMSSRVLTARLSGTRCRVSVLLREPPIVQGRYYRAAPLFARRFHRILTHSPSLACRVANARLVPHGGCWLRTVPDPSVPKTGRVSMIASGRRSAPGHRMRHRIAAWSRERCPDLVLLGRGYRPLEDKADGHAPFMFSVVIENSSEPGYFTEKIVDSMACGSVPIYWGAPDIARHFDARGIVACRGEEDLCGAIEAASEGSFRAMAAAVERNRVRALAYADFRAIAARVLESDRSFEPADP